jgi:hypothetical protein
MANLRRWEIRIPVPPKEVAEEIERAWPGLTTGTGTAGGGIEKTATEWRLWAELETDEELHAFADWFSKSIGASMGWTRLREYREQGEGMVELKGTLERLH